MDRRHLPDFSRLAPGREATGVYHDALQGKKCRELYPTNPEAQATCILNAMAQEAAWAREHGGDAGDPGLAAALDEAYANGMRAGELKGRSDVASNQFALLDELANIAMMQQFANSDNFLGDSKQRAEIVRRLRAAVRALQNSYDA